MIFGEWKISNSNFFLDYIVIHWPRVDKVMKKKKKSTLFGPLNTLDGFSNSSIGYKSEPTYSVSRY